MKKAAFCFLLLFALISCQQDQQKKIEPKQTTRKTGTFDVRDTAFASMVDTSYGIEILAEGFDWSEGPLWVEQGNYLLFSDIPPNKIMKWSEAGGLETYLHPSGYTGALERGGEPGSNGLLLDSQGRLVLCQHGDRRMARMDAPLNSPSAKFITLADKYEGLRLNSPNDAVFHSSGELYFTDPPYGLVKNMEDRNKEIPFQGVFRLRKDSTVQLLTDALSRPNGIAFSQDEKKLYVANSDVNKIWMEYPVKENGEIGEGKLFYDASADTAPGAPDGMKVHRSGVVFATGPGGVWVFSPEAKPLGIVRVGQLCSNVALDASQQFLYITADPWLVRVKLK